MIQTLEDYVYNLGDRRKYIQWANRSVDLESQHPTWSKEQVEALAFRQIFPELTLPPQFEPKP